MIQRWTAWVCLAVTLVMGAVPAHGLVLCLGPEGSVSVEVARDGTHCGGCSENAADQRAPADAGGVDDCTNCPCTDIPVVGPVDTTGKLPKHVDASFVELVTIQPSLGVRAISQASAKSVSIRAAPPRCAAMLPLIRSVVLHL